MAPSLDIFRVKSGYVLWCETALTVEMAQERIQELALTSPGDYLIFNQQTGQRTPVNRFSSQVEYPIAAETPRHDEKSCAQYPANRL